MAIGSRVLGKDVLRLILAGLSSLPVVVTQLDKRLARRNQRSASELVWLHRRRAFRSYEQTSGIKKSSTFAFPYQ